MGQRFGYWSLTEEGRKLDSSGRVRRREEREEIEIGAKRETPKEPRGRRRRHFNIESDE